MHFICKIILFLESLKWRFWPSIKKKLKICIWHHWHIICNYTPNENFYSKYDYTVEENNNCKKCTGQRATTTSIQIQIWEIYRKNHYVRKWRQVKSHFRNFWNSLFRVFLLEFFKFTKSNLFLSWKKNYAFNSLSLIYGHSLITI